MIKKILITVGILAFVIFTSGCNSIVKNFGGTMEVKLPPNTKLVNVTWKENNLWYVTRKRRADEPIETYTFYEQSDLKAVEGTIVIYEQ